MWATMLQNDGGLDWKIEPHHKNLGDLQGHDAPIISGTIVYLVHQKRVVNPDP